MNVASTQPKIAAALLVVLLTALATTAVLTYFIYERTLQALVTSRFEFIAKEMKSKVEAGIDLGLPLGELENISALLRQQVKMDDALLSLSIVNSRDTILFDTDDRRIGSQEKAGWLAPVSQATASGEYVYHGESEIAVPIFNSFGKLSGALALHYSKAYYDSKRADVATRVAEITLITLLAASVLGTVGVLTITRRLDHAIVRLDATLRSILVRIGLAPAASDSEFDNRITAFEQNVLVAVAALERAETAASGVETAASPTGALHPSPCGESR
ncbi:MAG: hypothetical protein IPK66_10415 [Rhodospirillales bacterium]|nr:hypothetical protein [Rhodospirillales bacterium]